MSQIVFFLLKMPYFSTNVTRTLFEPPLPFPAAQRLKAWSHAQCVKGLKRLKALISDKRND